MVPANTEAPRADLFDGTPITSGDAQAPIGRLVGDGMPDTITDAGIPDAISAAVGRPGYLSPYTETECVLAVDDRHEAAEFDRYYFPTAEQKAVLVDTVSGGLERARQEAEKQVAVKRQWCKKRGVKYMVVVEDTVTV